MSLEKRATYKEIKQEMLDLYFDFCRDRGMRLRLPHDQVLGGIDYEYENVFTLPIENMMLNTVQLILSGGWYPHVEATIRSWFSDQLSQHNLDDLLAEIPSDEAEEFRFDLQVLGLLK